MADNLKKVGKPDRDRINVNEPWEVKQWCAHFRCNEAELRAAVRATSVMVTDVEGYFRRNPPKGPVPN